MSAFRKNGHFYEKIGKKGESVCIDEEIPFEIPDSWIWCRLDIPCDIINGFTPSKSNDDFWKNGDIPWFTVADIHNQGRYIYNTEKTITTQALSKKSNRILPKNTVLLCCTASVGEYAMSKIELTTNQQFNGLKIRDLFEDFISSDYLFRICPSFKNQLLKVAGKTTFNYISVAKVKRLIIPIPPLNEQKRIVNKLEEILPLIEEYGVNEEKLTKLNKNFPSKLKSSILQEAIQGKLVPQNPNDEPASVLLEKIKDEKERLIKEKKIKRNNKESFIYKNNNHFYEIEGKKGEPICLDDEIPFEIPENWEWTRIKNIVTKLTDGAHKTPKYVDKGIPFLSVKDMSSGYLDFSDTKYISQEDFERIYQRCNYEYGDILLTKVGTTGIPIIIDTKNDFGLFVSVALLKFNHEFIYNEFLVHLINSPLVQLQCIENTKGVGNKNWVLRDIGNTLITIPPLNEQIRIVEKLEEIFQKI